MVELGDKVYEDGLVCYGKANGGYPYLYAENMRCRLVSDSRWFRDILKYLRFSLLDEYLIDEMVILVLVLPGGGPKRNYSTRS